MKNNTIKIFISSTFREMISERDAIQQIVFTKIRFWGKKLGINIIPIDLRWGITESDILEGKLAAQCEDAINECWPYFIAVLGNTYGTDNPKVLGKVEKKYRGKSITDYEITKGVLESNNTHALIYNVHYSNTKEQLLKKRKLKKLKNSINQTTKMIEINLQDRLILTMINDIKRVISNSFQQSLAHDKLEKDTFFQKNVFFSSYYSRFFKNFFDGYQMPQSHLSVFCSPEYDTSIVFLYNLVYSKSSQCENLFFLHDFQATSYDKSFKGFIEHLIDYLAKAVNVFYIDNYDIDTCYSLLSQVKTRIYITVNSMYAINKKECDRLINQFLSHSPSNTFLLCSDYYGSNCFGQRVNRINIKPFNSEQVKEYVRVYMSEYKKDINFTLTDNIINHFLKAPSYDISFLNVVLNEVLLRGCPSEKILSEIDSLIKSTTVENLFSAIICRTLQTLSESVHQLGITQITCVLVCLVRDYILMEDIQRILQDMNFKSADIIDVLEIISELISISDGQIRCRYLAMKKAVFSMFEENIKAIEDIWINYLNSQPTSLHIIVERISYYERNGNNDRIAEEIVASKSFPLLFYREKSLLYSYAAKVNREKLNALTEKCFDSYRSVSLKLCEAVIDFLIDIGEYKLALKLTDRIVSTASDKYIWNLKTGYIYREICQYQKAIDIFNELLGVTPTNDETKIKLYDYMSYCLGKTGNYEEAEKYADMAIQARRLNLTKFEFDLPVSLNSLAYVYFSQGKFEEAESCYREAYEIRIKYFGADHPRAVANMNNIAKIYLREEKYSEALKILSKCYHSFQTIMGESHIYSNICLLNVLLCQLKLDLELPEKILQQVKDVSNNFRKHIKNTDYNAFINLLMGLCYQRMDNVDLASEFIEKAYKYYSDTFSEESFECRYIRRQLVGNIKETINENIG